MPHIPFSIQLCVADLGATEAFYAGILNLPVQRVLVSGPAPDYLALRQDGFEMLFIQDVAMMAHPVLQARVENLPRGVGMTLHLSVTEIDDIYEELLDEELEVLYPLELKPYGARELWVFDPDGYLVVLEETAR